MAWWDLLTINHICCHWQRLSRDLMFETKDSQDILADGIKSFLSLLVPGFVQFCVLGRKVSALSIIRTFGSTPPPSVRLLDSDGHRIPDSSGLSDCNTPCPTSELLPPRETTAPSCWLSPPLLLVAYKSRQRQQITCFVLPILSFWKSKEKSVCHCFKLSHQKVWAVLSTLFWTFQINFGPVKFWVRFQQNQVSTGSRFILRRVYI